MEIIDINDFLERVAEDKELLMELLNDFIEDYKEKRKLLDEAIEKKDFERIAVVVHTIKGAASNISVKVMANCCMIMEQLAINKEMDLIKELVADLDGQFSELTEYFYKLK